MRSEALCHHQQCAQIPSENPSWSTTTRARENSPSSSSSASRSLATSYTVIVDITSTLPSKSSIWITCWPMPCDNIWFISNHATLCNIKAAYCPAPKTCDARVHWWSFGSLSEHVNDWCRWWSRTRFTIWSLCLSEVMEGKTRPKVRFSFWKYIAHHYYLLLNSQSQYLSKVLCSANLVRRLFNPPKTP